MRGPRPACVQVKRTQEQPKRGCGGLPGHALGGRGRIWWEVLHGGLCVAAVQEAELQGVPVVLPEEQPGVGASVEGKAKASENCDHELRGVGATAAGHGAGFGAGREGCGYRDGGLTSRMWRAI